MSADPAEFRAALLDPERAVPAGLLAPGGGPAGARFDVYRNNVVAGLSRALAEAFPTVAALLGEHNFAILARAFLRRHPPAAPVLAEWGDAFPAFVADFPQVEALGYLADVASLDLALRGAYHAADATPLDPARLAAVPPERLPGLGLRLAPAVRLVASDWPVVAIWQFHHLPGAPKPRMAAEWALVTRPGFDPVATALDPAAGSFVTALARGAPLSVATAEALARDPGFDPAPTVAALLGGAAVTDLTEEPMP